MVRQCWVGTLAGVIALFSCASPGDTAEARDRSRGDATSEGREPTRHDAGPEGSARPEPLPRDASGFDVAFADSAPVDGQRRADARGRDVTGNDSGDRVDSAAPIDSSRDSDATHSPPLLCRPREGGAPTDSSPPRDDASPDAADASPPSGPCEAPCIRALLDRCAPDAECRTMTMDPPASSTTWVSAISCVPESGYWVIETASGWDGVIYSGLEQRIYKDGCLCATIQTSVIRPVGISLATFRDGQEHIVAYREGLSVYCGRYPGFPAITPPDYVEQRSPTCPKRPTCVPGDCAPIPAGL